MLTIHKKINLDLGYDFTPAYEYQDLVFFDIETTGFSANTTMLYLIGCIYYSQNSWHIIQWFSDDNNSEKEILDAFFPFISNFKLLLHYNGTGFDIPYLLKKCQAYDLNYNFNGIESLDIYKQILPYKKILKLENLKQKTVENFLDVHRLDKYSGKQLIAVYAEYLQCRYVVSKNVDAALTNRLSLKSDECYELLLLHNEDDLKGLLEITKILNYPDIFLGEFTLLGYSIKGKEFVVDVNLSCHLPKRVSYGTENVYFSAYGSTAQIKVKLYENELKFFYSNYKDYFYLPKEDTAVHKSVAFYVDKDYRTKAKAANCYSKKTGRFVPQFEETVSPYFKIDYFDKVTYVEVNDDFLNNKSQMNHYVMHLLHKLAG